MPFMKNISPCKKYQEENKLTRLRWNRQNNKYYLQSTCNNCEKNWNNFAVIPKVENLRKGNYHSIHA